MKRRAVFILLLLVAGAIVNVAVAWGCMYRGYSAGRSANASTSQDFTATWERLALPGWTAEPFRGHESNGFGVKTVSAHAGQWQTTLANGTQASLPRYMTSENSAGWPLLAVRSMHWIDNSNVDWTTAGNISLPIAPNSRRPDIDLPFAPIWPGFAINTVFYAAVLWLVFATPFALRKRRRIKRGLCPKCAYPVGTNAVCTECGAAVTPRPKAATA